MPLPLEPKQQTLAAILAFTIVYWLSEAIPKMVRSGMVFDGIELVLIVQLVPVLATLIIA